MIRIERRNASSEGATRPHYNPRRGYELADPAGGPNKHHRTFAVFVRSIEEAADLIERSGFSIRMDCGQPGRPPLIAPRSLKIIRS